MEPRGSDGQAWRGRALLMNGGRGHHPPCRNPGSRPPWGSPPRSGPTPRRGGGSRPARGGRSIRKWSAPTAGAWLSSACMGRPPARACPWSRTTNRTGGRTVPPAQGRDCVRPGTRSLSVRFMVQAAKAAIASVDPAVENAARTLGSTEFEIFGRSTLPLARRGIIAGALLGAARAFGEFGATLMVAGSIPSRTQTAPLAIYDAVQAGRYADARALGLLTTALVFASILVVQHLAAKPGPTPLRHRPGAMTDARLRVNVERDLPGFRLDARLEVGAEVMVLFGPSGTGNTMLLDIIAGRAPAAKAVRSGDRRRARRRVRFQRARRSSEESRGATRPRAGGGGGRQLWRPVRSVVPGFRIRGDPGWRRPRRDGRHRAARLHEPDGPDQHRHPRIHLAHHGRRDPRAHRGVLRHGNRQPEPQSGSADAPGDDGRNASSGQRRRAGQPDLHRAGGGGVSGSVCLREPSPHRGVICP
jgi:hypothetical protein